MKKFIGDISNADAALLERYARRSRAILEFGVGGSTQVIAQSLRKGARFISIDTSAEWIQTTRTRLAKLGVADRCSFIPYATWATTKGRFDFIFVDGAFKDRRTFALAAWPRLVVGGHMLFHDTRRAKDIENVLALITARFEEIGAVHFNKPAQRRTSNITVIQKKQRETRENWRRVEGKPEWAYGIGSVPESFWG